MENCHGLKSAIIKKKKFQINDFLSLNGLKYYNYLNTYKIKTFVKITERPQDLLYESQQGKQQTN